MGTVGNDDTGRAVFFQNRNHAAYRAACAQKQNGFAFDGNIFDLSDVVGQTDTIGVVAAYSAVFQPHQRIDRAGSQSAVGMFVRQRKSFLFERDGYIRTLPSLGTKRRNSLGKIADFGTNALIFNGRAFLKCELLMDLRRFTVCNGIAENGVTRGVVHKTGLKKQKKRVLIIAVFMLRKRNVKLLTIKQSETIFHCVKTGALMYFRRPYRDRITT